MDNPRTFWDTFTTAYQMGEQKHRMYLLNLLNYHHVKTLLDVGCGTGPIYEIIKNHQMPLEYKGVDYSPAMIEVAKGMFPEADFAVEDARKLTEESESWDCVLLLHSLDHIDDYKAVIGEAARVSRKYVCIVLWRSFVAEGTNLNDRNMMGKKEGEAPWEDTHLHEYSRQVLEEEFVKNKLRIIHVAEGEAINSDHSKYNFLYLLSKEEAIWTV